MPAKSPAAARCPICGQAIDPAIQQFKQKPDRHLARILRAQHPDWEAESGACPTCLFRAAWQAQTRRSDQPLPDDSQHLFPIYHPDQTELLPTPARVHANPRYAGQGVTMAFLDSGFYPHPDLTRPINRIVCHVDATTAAFVERPRFKRATARAWHGLMTSCVAAGNGFMSHGLYPGIATRAGLVLVKTGHRRGRANRITDRDIARALDWVLEHYVRFNIRVVNISLGGDHPTTGELTDLDEKVEQAVARGLVVVCAAGNSGEARIVPPASAPSAITVGGLDDQNSLNRRLHRLYPTSYGRGAGGSRKPDLLAPARWLAAPMLPRTSPHNEALFLWRVLRAEGDEFERVVNSRYAQSRLSKKTLAQPPDEIRRAIRERMKEQKFIHPHYQHVDGTSMAAPIVAAVAAQMLEANPALTPAEVKALLLATARPLPNTPAERQGHGALHAGRAVAAAMRAAANGLVLKGFSPQRTITFQYHDRDAQHVALVGTFNDWSPRGHELRRLARGVWQITLPDIGPGLHAYKFLVDRERWVADPENPSRLDDGTGGFYSLLTFE